MTEPVFTKNEMNQLEPMEKLVEALASDRSDDSNDPAWLQGNRFYKAIQKQAQIALFEFMKRGKFDEGIKQFDVPSEKWLDPFRS